VGFTPRLATPAAKEEWVDERALLSTTRSTLKPAYKIEQFYELCSFEAVLLVNIYKYIYIFYI
jgi:hypothetical protein